MSNKYIHYMEIEANGERSYGSLPEGIPLPEGAIVVEFQPDNDFEVHDPANGEIIIDTQGRADHEAGSKHISEAHVIKAIQAQLIKSGVSLPDSLVYKEAFLRNIDIEEMADMILSKAAERDAVELARQKASMPNEGEVP